MSTVTDGVNMATTWPYLCAFFPTSTTNLRRGSSARSSARCCLADPRSRPVAGRMRCSSPMYQGMAFHITVRERCSPASTLTSKKFLAVSSGLLRDTKPAPIALLPGASRRNRHSALTPPSIGSKSGTPAGALARKHATNATSGCICARSSACRRAAIASDVFSDFARSNVIGSCLTRETTRPKLLWRGHPLLLWVRID